MNGGISKGKLLLVALCSAVLMPVASHAQVVPVIGISRAIATVSNQQIQGLAMDNQGNIYMSTQPGVQMPGAAQPTLGQILKLNCPSGGACWGSTPTTIGSSLSNPKGLTLDSSGNLYVADAGTNSVVKIAPNGLQTTVLSGLNQPSDVKVDSSGSLYIADTGNNKIVKVSFAASGARLAPILISLPAGASPVSVAVDLTGNLFVASPSQAILKLSPYGAGAYATQYWGGLQATKNTSLATDSAGDLLVLTDSWLWQISPTQNITKRLQALDISPASVAGNVGLAMDLSGNPIYGNNQNGSFDVYVSQGTSAYGGTIGLWNSSTACSSPTCYQKGIFTFYFSQNATVSQVLWLTENYNGYDFQGPNVAVNCMSSDGTAVTPPNIPAGTWCTLPYRFSPNYPGLRHGTVELLDQSNTSIAAAYVYGIGTAPQYLFPYPGAVVTLASGLSQPTGMSVTAGEVLALENGNKQIVQVAPGIDQAYTVGISDPWGFAMDGAGNKYISDKTTGNIYVLYGFVPSTPGVIGSGLLNPSGLALDGSGNVYVADTGNSRVVRITAPPQGCNTLCGQTQTTIGTGLIQPVAVAVDAAGNVYVADQALNHVIKIAPNGSQTTLDRGGLSQPSGVAVDAAGDVFVSQLGGNPVMLTASGAQITLCTTVGPTYSIGIDPDSNVYLGTETSIVKLPFTEPPALNFPATSVGSASNPVTVTLVSTGNAALDFSTIVVPNGFAQVTGSGSMPDCKASSPIDTGAGCLLELEFKPAAPGNFQDQVTFIGSMVYRRMMNLSGTALYSQTISFAPVSDNPGATVKFSISDSAGLPVTLTSLTPAVCRVVSSQFVAGQVNAVTIAAGTCAIEASQPGNSTYMAAPKVTQSFKVLP